jgi:pyruvate,water dikinase
MTAPYGVTQFEFNDFDLAEGRVWFCDVTHGTPPWKPLYLMYGWALYTRIQRCYERLHVPNSKGWDVRIKDGYVYVGVMLTSEHEAKQRAPIFREKIRPFVEDFNGQWDREKHALKKTYEDLRAKHGLESYDSISALAGIELSDLWEEYLLVHTKQWDVHMGNFIPIYYLFGLFENTARELLGLGHSSPLFSKVMSGFDSSALGFNREIWALGRLALELDTAQAFAGTEDAEVVIGTLRESAAGNRWLAAYDRFLELYGWRCERMLEWATPTWLEKPSLGIPLIRLAVAAGAASSLGEKQRQAVQEREEAEKELLARVPAEQRDWFAILMRSAQNAGYFSEDHTYYCDLYTSAMGRWITREIGRRFAEAGAIDNLEDIYFLIPGEISKALIPMDRVKLQSYVDARKQEWEGYLTATPEMLLGNAAAMAEIARRDPVISAAASVPREREDVKADLYGSASVPGVVEGIARVVMTEHELGGLQPGEILVAPGTSAQWTPAFEIAGGIVTDGGGALSHAVIVAREYRLPAVTGTQAATRTIKSGDKVRVDGDLGLVFVTTRTRAVESHLDPEPRK